MKNMRVSKKDGIPPLRSLTGKLFDGHCLAW
ncbi:hypothetical protein BH11PSE12_BH11PSE12_04050 [soil metagenome]